MNCTRCTVFPETEIQAATVYISVPTHLHADHLEKVLQQLGLSFSMIDQGYLVETDDFKALVQSLVQNHLNDREQNDILILPLNTGEMLSFETLSRFKSLLQWNARLEGQDLKEILLRRSLKIEFQPIVEAHSGTTVAYEALSRGIREDGSVMPPEEMFNKARSMELIFALDRICREVVIDEVKRHGIREKVFINFNPNAIYDPEKCLQSTIAAIDKNGLPYSQFVFEVVETEEVKDYNHLRGILDFYKRRGFGVALDDVGSGFNDEATLHHLIPDYIKIDMGIIRNIHQHPAQQRKMLEYVRIARKNSIRVLAEGIETREELDFLMESGVDLMQGYYFGRPSDNPISAE